MQNHVCFHPLTLNSDLSLGLSFDQNRALKMLKEKMNSNIIIIRLKFKSSEVEMTVSDARYTLSDKIANFGGTFGIWAELTGFSLLGIINIYLILFKICFKFSSKSFA